MTDIVKFTFESSTNRKNFVSIAIFAFISLVCAYFTEWPDNAIQHLDGTFASGNEVKKGNYISVLIYMPIWGLIFGSLLSVFPFKKLSYKAKWSRFTLVAILVFSILSFFSLAISLIRYVFEI